MSSAYKSKKAPEDVFTPRASEINERMYIARPSLEESLTDAIKSTKYIAIHGESGNGKTWLYRKVFKENNVHFETINLANADLAGSLVEAMREKLGELGFKSKEIQTEEFSGGIKPQGIGYDAKKGSTERLAQKGALSSLMAAIRSKAGKRKAVLVLDNFEQVLDSKDILKEISSVIISADDDVISKNNVKVAIVGVPGDIKSLISKTRNATTIANRLTEIPEVERMTTKEASDLMKKGLESELGLKLLIPEKPFYTELCWKTDRIAQHIHELCLKIANEAVRSSGNIDKGVVDRAEKKWIADSLSADWAVIESVMNARETRAGRKNQVIYSLGKCDKEDFKYTDIEKIVRSEFPESTDDVILNVTQILTSLSGSENPLIRRTPKNDAYRFVSPKLRMAIRTGLRKTDQETVEKVP